MYLTNNGTNNGHLETILADIAIARKARLAEQAKREQESASKVPATVERIPYIVKYVITGNDGAEKRGTGRINALDSVDAHARANRARGVVAARAAGNSVTMRLYPDTDSAAGIMRGAIIIASRTAENGIMRTGGNAAQQAVAQDLRCIKARVSGCADAVRIMDIMSSYGADAQEYIAIAYDAIIQARSLDMGIMSQYHAGYLWLNKYIKERRQNNKDISSEWLRDNGGDLVAMTDIVACIIRGGDRWNPTSGAGMDEAEAAALGNVIYESISTLTPIQKKVVRLMMREYSGRAIAQKLNVAEATARAHVHAVRLAIAKYIDAYAPQYAAIVSSASVKTDAIETEAAERTQRRMDKHGAAYYAEWRARKALALLSEAARAEAEAEAMKTEVDLLAMSDEWKLFADDSDALDMIATAVNEAKAEALKAAVKTARKAAKESEAAIRTIETETAIEARAARVADALAAVLAEKDNAERAGDMGRFVAARARAKELAAMNA